MINMFDIKNLSIRDYIICGLLLVISFLIYKYFTNSNKIKLLEDEINDLNNKINLNKQIVNNNTNTNLNYETDNYSTTDDNTINYKTGQTLETFNNNLKEVNRSRSSLSKETILKQNNIECNEDICYIKKSVENDKHLGQFEQKMNNLSKEVDNIIKSDVYIPIDLKQIINNVYNFPEINDDEDDIDDIDDIDNIDNIDALKEVRICSAYPSDDIDVIDDIDNVNENYNNNFNPIIINNEIKITQDDIEKNNIIQIPDFINIPLGFELDEKSSEKKIDLDIEPLNKTLLTLSDNEKELNSDDEKENNSDVELNKRQSTKDKQLNNKVKNIKINDMKINDIKNLAKEFNIKVTENGRPKNKDQLVKEINKHKNKTSNI